MWLLVGVVDGGLLKREKVREKRLTSVSHFTVSGSKELLEKALNHPEIGADEGVHRGGIKQTHKDLVVILEEKSKNS